jgi:hypothetical protein
MMLEIGTVLDAGFPVGPMNRANAQLMQWAAQKGLRCLSMRDGDEALRAISNEAREAGNE